MYPLYDEYSMVVIAYDKSNSIKYDLISEAIKLTSDVKKSDTATYAKSSDDVKFSDISGKLFE